jgi:hypothetical protein
MNPFSPAKGSMYGSPEKSGIKTVFSSNEKTFVGRTNVPESY